MRVISRERKKGHPFYSSGKWRSVRESYLKKVHWICEECGRPASQVHHKEELTENDYFVNYEKCYGFENLKALCLDCHNKQPGHFAGHSNRQAIAEGYKVNMETGEIEIIPPH